MTIIEALKNAKDGQIIERKYSIDNGMTFTKSCIARVDKDKRWLSIKWGGNILLEDFEATNWKIFA